MKPRKESQTKRPDCDSNDTISQKSQPYRDSKDITVQQALGKEELVHHKGSQHTENYFTTILTIKFEQLLCIGGHGMSRCLARSGGRVT